MIRLFKHYIPRLVLVLALLEALLFLASVYAGVAIRFSGDPFNRIPLHTVWVTAVIFAVIMLVTIHAMGLYRREMREDFWDSIFRLGSGFLLGLSAVTLVYYVLPQLYVGRGAFGLSFGIAFSGSILLRALFHKLGSLESFKRKILVVAAVADAEQLLALSNKYTQSSFSIVGFLPDQEDEGDLECAAELMRCEAGIDIAELALELEVEEIVAAAKLSPAYFEQLMCCKLQGIPVTQTMTFYERETGQIRLDVISRDSLLFSDGYRRTTIQVYAKRLFDILCSTLLLLVAWPVMLLTALALKMESRWRDPVFYRQSRVGQFGEEFEVIKFRSMSTDAEASGAQWAVENDPRVTGVGAVLRNLRIDELPQLLNVLRGEMSFVGPRPERRVFVDQLAAEIEHFELRHLIKPGITGWAQISYPYGASVEDSRQKLQYDLYYVKNQTMFLDLAIALQTVYVILWGQGAR